MPRDCTRCGIKGQGGLDIVHGIRAGSQMKEEEMLVKIHMEPFWMEFCGACQLTLEHELDANGTLLMINYREHYPASQLARLNYIHKKYSYKTYLENSLN